MSNTPYDFPNYSTSPQYEGTITYNEEQHGDTYGNNTTVGRISRDEYIYRDDRSPPRTQMTETSYAYSTQDSVPPPQYNQHPPQTRSESGGGSSYPHHSQSQYQHQHRQQSATGNVVHNRNKYGDRYGDGTRVEWNSRDRHMNLAPNTPIYTATSHSNSNSTRASTSTYASHPDSGTMKKSKYQWSGSYEQALNDFERDGYSRQDAEQCLKECGYDPERARQRLEHLKARKARTNGRYA
ncbi:hypothetical protein AAF712_009013 [Marasmius tenuissimus]|uniref:UBA domain-containing protein n=1 Tax=Marasmius tenuissimus TaxID=585030 RepID=A0ABR2ZUQ6_9AGAR